MSAAARAISQGIPTESSARLTSTRNSSQLQPGRSWWLIVSSHFARLGLSSSVSAPRRSQASPGSRRPARPSPQRAGHNRSGRPSIRVLGVGAAGQTLAVDAQEVIRPAAARPERGQRPQRAGEGFHLDRAARVGHAGVAKVQPCAALGIQRQQRVQKSVHQRRKSDFVCNFITSTAPNPLSISSALPCRSSRPS